LVMEKLKLSLRCKRRKIERRKFAIEKLQVEDVRERFQVEISKISVLRSYRIVKWKMWRSIGWRQATL
jgi:hypothetical protein